MTIGEYITIFAAILVGLAVTDIALSFCRLQRAGRTVKWDWLSPIMALIVLIGFSAVLMIAAQVYNDRRLLGVLLDPVIRRHVQTTRLSSPKKLRAFSRQ